MKKLLSLLLVSTLVLGISGCRKKQVIVQKKAPVTLTYYKLYENESDLTPLFTEFKKKYPYVSVQYRKFTDPNKYFETILNEFAEGRGPDVFSVPNWWVKPNYLKLQEAPSNIINGQVYRNLFLDIAATDNIILDTENNEHVYGIPLSIDTLAVYYNKSHFEAAIPERGKPSNTWIGMQSDARVMNFKNNNALLRSMVAMGNPEFNSKEIDILYNRMLQTNASFYNNSFSNASFAKSSDIEKVTKNQLAYGDYRSAVYALNENIVNPESADKEVEAFLTGKTSMIFGYSHLYKDMLNLHRAYQRSGKEVIDIGDIQITQVPQESTDDTPVAYANYFTEVVSKNSKNAFESWALISNMVSKTSLEMLYDKNFKPTSRRDLIPTQRQNRIYFPFVNQLGFAKSLPIADDFKYRDIFADTLTNLLDTENYQVVTRKGLSDAQAQINAILSTKPLNQVIPANKK